MIDRKARGSQRQLVWAHREEIIEKLNAGYNIGNIQDELGLTDISPRTFRYNVKALKQEHEAKIRLLEMQLLKAALDTLRPNPPKNKNRRKTSEQEKPSPTASESTPNAEALIQSEIDRLDAKPRRKRKFRYGKAGGIPEGQRPLDPQKRK